MKMKNKERKSDIEKSKIYLTPSEELNYEVSKIFLKSSHLIENTPCTLNALRYRYVFKSKVNRDNTKETQ